MRDLASDVELMSLLRQTLELLERRDLASVTDLMREDAVAVSPFAEGHEGAHRFHGREEIRDHFRAVQGQFAKFRLQDVFSDGLIYKVLLSDGDRRIIVVIEPDSDAARIKRLTICPSLLSRVLKT